MNAEEAAATIFSKVYCPIEQNCRRYAMALFCCFVGGGVMFLFFTAIGLVPLLLMCTESVMGENMCAFPFL